jgi:hypothetical protein
MDLYEAKTRIAEALVESIFRRAEYQVCSYRSTHSASRRRREDFSPNFSVTKKDADGSREFLVEVEYRPSVEQFLSLEAQRRESSIFTLTRRHWPTLQFVLVTDRPEPGRSCFQAVSVGGAPGQNCGTVDLADVKELNLFEHNVRDHGELLVRIFSFLTRA